MRTGVTTISRGSIRAFPPVGGTTVHYFPASTGGNFTVAASVSGAKVWKVWAILGRNRNRNSRIFLHIESGALDFDLHDAAPGPNKWVSLMTGGMELAAGETLAARFANTQIGDTCDLVVVYSEVTLP